MFSFKQVGSCPCGNIGETTCVSSRAVFNSTIRYKRSRYRIITYLFFTGIFKVVQIFPLRCNRANSSSFFYPYILRSSGGVVVKLLACDAEDRSSIPGPAATISEIGYILLPNRDMTERSRKRRKSSNQPTNQSYILKFYQWCVVLS